MKAFKYRCYPTDDQKLLLERTFGCCRFVWNQCLAQANAEYEAWKANPELPRPNVSGYDFTKRLPYLKRQYSFLNEVSAVALQQTLLNLGKAFQGLFIGGGYPQFKSKHYSKKSICLVGNALRISKNVVYFAKSVSPLRVSWKKRRLPGEHSAESISGPVFIRLISILFMWVIAIISYLGKKDTTLILNNWLKKRNKYV